MARQSSSKEPGANARYVKNAVEGYKHERVDTRDPKAIEARITEYLAFCQDNDVSPSVTACANWLGVTRASLEGWRSGMKGSPEHQRVASRFYGVLEDVWAQNMAENTVNPVSGIFMGKVFYGYQDTQEIVVNKVTTNIDVSVADLIAESKRLPGADNPTLTENPIIDVDAVILDAESKPEPKTIPLPAPEPAPVPVKKKQSPKEQRMERKLKRQMETKQQKK